MISKLNIYTRHSSSKIDAPKKHNHLLCSWASHHPSFAAHSAHSMLLHAQQSPSIAHWCRRCHYEDVDDDETRWMLKTSSLLLKFITQKKFCGCYSTKPCAAAASTAAMPLAARRRRAELFLVINVNIYYEHYYVSRPRVVYRGARQSGMQIASRRKRRAQPQLSHSQQKLQD